MGTKYSSQTISGYNASAPPDDGSTGSNNLVTWANHKTKLADPLKTLAESINTALVTALNFGSRTTATSDSAAASDHMKTIECTATATITLPDATTIASGYIVGIANTGSGTVTVNLTTATDTLNGTANGTLSLAQNQYVVVKTNTSANGYFVESNTIYGVSAPKIPTITATVGSSALTIGMTSQNLDFRSATLTSGTVTTLLAAPSNLVISSGSTLGTTSATLSRIMVLAINNAGTVELAAVNVTGGTNLSEHGVISTTAEGGAGAADSATVAYSTTARTNVAYRVVGYVESTQATAGTWATAPSTIQGYSNFPEIKNSRIRVDTMNGYGSTNTQLMRFTSVTINYGGTDITYADSATNGASFTINTSGTYAITYQADFSTASAHGITVNDNQGTINIDNTAMTASHLLAVQYSTAASPTVCSTIHYFTAGDIVYAHANANTVGTYNHAFFEIVRLN